MPRKKTKADEQYNARRRAKRALAKYDKIGRELNAKAYASIYNKIGKQLDALSNAVENSYFNKKLKKYNLVPKNIDKLSRQVRSGIEPVNNAYKAAKRASRFSRVDNNRLTKMQEISFHKNGQMARWEQAHFYSYTQFIWDRSAPEQRDNVIVDYLENAGVKVKINGKEVPVTNLKYAFEFVKQQHEEDWERKRRSNKLKRTKKSYWTDEDEEFMNEFEEEPTSPLPDSAARYGIS
jgi:hypothetical protein